MKRRCFLGFSSHWNGTSQQPLSGSGMCMQTLLALDWRWPSPSSSSVHQASPTKEKGLKSTAWRVPEDGHANTSGSSSFPIQFSDTWLGFWIWILYHVAVDLACTADICKRTCGLYELLLHRPPLLLIEWTSIASTKAHFVSSFLSSGRFAHEIPSKSCF